jgi:hypothetical protein
MFVEIDLQTIKNRMKAGRLSPSDPIVLETIRQRPDVFEFLFTPDKGESK